MGSKQISEDRWVEFCDTVTDGNRGRKVTIELAESSGDRTLIKEASFLSLVCDPAGKGNDITIETGESQVNYAHTVTAPTEVTENQAESGKLAALEINDKEGTKTLVSFSS